MREVPQGYLKPSMAKSELAERMFGGLPRRQDIVELKRRHRGLHVRPGAWQETAAKRLREAAIAGEISVFAWNRPRPAGSAPAAPVRLPIAVVSRLIPIRQSLPDHPYRLQFSLLRTGLVTPELFAALQNGTLVLEREEFEKWWKSERRRGLWPSQRSSKKSRPGRPSKNTNALRSRVMAFVEEGIWTADQPVMSLRRVLAEKDYWDIPSHDSLARLVDELHLETGDPRFRRKIRKRQRY